MVQWFELLRNGTFYVDTLEDVAPHSFMVDWPYIHALNHSWLIGRDRVWLHHLHRGIALKQQAGQYAAANHLHKSVSLKPNPLAIHILGVIALHQRSEGTIWILLGTLPVCFQTSTGLT
jgi:hypothetical protein